MRIDSVEQFNAALANGPYAWPGGYPLYFLMADGEALSFKAAQSEAERIRAEFSDPTDSAWRVVDCAVNWEDSDLFCAHTNERIESAYAD